MNSSRIEGDDFDDVQSLGPKVVYVTEFSDSDDSSVEDETEEEKEAQRWKDSKKRTEIPSEFWHIQKLIKYMKAGNQTATIVALACLKDHNLNTEINQSAIRECGGLEVLVNLLETDNLKCKLGTISVLRDITQDYETRKLVTDLGGVPLLVKLLNDSARPLQILVAETLANVAKMRKAQKIVRKTDGLPQLIDLLDVPQQVLTVPWDDLDQDKKEMVYVVRGGIKALWSLSQCRKNKEAMRKAGIVRILARLLRCAHEDIISPTLGTIQQCATEKNYQLAIQTEGMICDLVKFLSSTNEEIKKYCASAIFKCAAADEVTRSLVREHGGLDPLVLIIKNEKNRQNKPLLAAATGAIWKCAMTHENVRRLDELRTVNVLIHLLEDEDEEVLTNVVGALGECAKVASNRDAIKRSNGIEPLVNLLNLTNPELLENVTKVLGECANDMTCMEEIQVLDGVRLIWSLLKNPSQKVQANAALALSPCIQNAQEAGELVRSFVGGLELIVSLLKSDDTKVLACVCAAISKVATDRENLAVISDHGVVMLLAQLVDKRMYIIEKGFNGLPVPPPEPQESDKEEDDLREHLSSAIANCCEWGTNCRDFGRLGAVAPLVSYMASGNKKVHRTTALALCKLSADPFNCITLHQSGVVPYLLDNIGSSDLVLQEAAAGCLGNIRKLALAADQHKYYDVPD
uniref:Armadillo repeat-containing protein 4 n=1 Tax=Cacopsylla melanoneura TaxID=428564 RepID=A0A8D8SK84_9HEMI